jgi:hypothetical protein
MIVFLSQSQTLPGCRAFRSARIKKKKKAAAEGSELRYVVLPDRRLYLYANTPVIIAFRLFSRIAPQRYISIKYIVSK